MRRFEYLPQAHVDEAAANAAVRDAQLKVFASLIANQEKIGEILAGKPVNVAIVDPEAWGKKSPTK